VRILLATDAWRPQVNGVVRTYEALSRAARLAGDEIVVLSPLDYNTVPCPTYPQIRLALPNVNTTSRRISELRLDAIHIATEGPVGWMTRAYCRRRKLPFTTSFHTRFPEYLSARFQVPEAWTYAAQRHFHNSAAGMMVATPSLAKDLKARGFKRILLWTRGVDTVQFRPLPVRRFGADPVFLYVGRIATEKNIEGFLSLTLPGRKVVVGDGPQLDSLRRIYPDAVFAGEKTGEDLAQCYASADVFVFPSRTDTFGIVLLEAMACGLPVAALPVSGPLDVVKHGLSGILDNDLRSAALRALSLDRSSVREHATAFSWAKTYQQFIANIKGARAIDTTPAAAMAIARTHKI
jgi:glycosyltransferase involved in cell wall biosynthesis